MNKFDGIIFDVDGVLVDVSNSQLVAVEKATQYFLSKKGYKIKVTQDDVSAIKSLPGFNNDWDATYVLIDLLSENVDRNDFKKKAKRLNRLVRKETLLIKKSVLKKWQLAPLYFQQKYIVTEDDIYETKPHPAPLLEAKKRMNSKNLVYIGDTINNVIAAKNAKMSCVFVGSKKLGDYQVKSINDILEVIPI